jgi:ABC-type glutathione transport system ATPase component
MTALYEQYRPRDLSEVVGQDQAVGKVKLLANRGLVGRVFWITGPSGTGKTTLARIIAEDVAGSEAATEEIDAQDLNMETAGWRRLGLHRQRGPRAVVQGGEQAPDRPGESERSAVLDVVFHDDAEG